MNLPPDLAESVSRCLITGFTGLTPSDDLRRLVAEGIGGVILAARNVSDFDQVRALTDALRAEREDVLVSIDAEGGGIGHLTRAGAPEVPGNWALGVADDLALTAEVASTVARHLARAGITVNYAPVADVQRDAANPIVRVRSFGADPELVSRHVRAWVEATVASGVAACAKHFPGHGRTTADSHLALPSDGSSLPELDLEPFRAGIADGVPMIMTAHVLYPRLDSLPATLSPALITGLLRDTLGYDGVVVTDALEMAAISGSSAHEPHRTRPSSPAAAVPLADAARSAASDGGIRALAAGADIALFAVRDLTAVLDCRASICAAVADGTLDPARVVESAARVRALAARFATPPPASGAVGTAAAGGAAAAVPAAAAAAAAADQPGLRAARQALGHQSVPAVGHKPYVVDLFKPPHPALGAEPTDLVALLAERLPGTEGVAITSGPADTGEILRAAEGRALIVATEDAVLNPWQAQARDALRAHRQDAILIATGLPEPGAFCTYGHGKANLQAAAELLS